MTILANDKMRLIVTGKCNLDCFYCHNEGQAKEETFIRLRDVENLAKTFREHGISAAEVTISGGEPFLHKQLSEIVGWAKTFADKVTMVSNGILADASKLELLAECGLGKIRLGVDSLSNIKPRPSPGYLRDPFLVREVIDAAKAAHLAVDLNVVVTKFNKRELSSLAQFAVTQGLSIKFFEHVEVGEFGAIEHQGKMRSAPHVTFDEFLTEIRPALGTDVRFSADEQFGDANLRCEVNGAEIRYCRYLCTYDLCWLTGTRVDAQGYVYNCMVNRGIDQIRAGSRTSDLDIIERASLRPCRAGLTERS